MVKSIFSKIIFSSLLLLCLFSPASSLAQSPTPVLLQNLLYQKQKAIKNNTGLETWTNEAFLSNLTALFIGLNGTIPEEVFNQLNTTSYLPGGAVGQINGYISSLQTPPASGIEYLAQVKNNFLGKPAYAQGVGFQGLQFLLPIWRGFRNVVYILTSLFFIFIGIMIMLRVKVSPQAVITVQSAIPRIIASLILVTFSYAIAGLIIDFCNLIQAMVISLLFSMKGIAVSGQLFGAKHWFSEMLTGEIQGDNIENFDLSFSNLSNPDSKIANFLMTRLSVSSYTSILLGGMIGKMIAGVVGDIAGMSVGVILPVLISIAIFFWVIKLLFGMIKCYGTVIFKLILAPLEIGMGAIPNSKINFSSWFMDIISNALVFPIITIILVLSNVVIDLLLKGAKSTGNIWMPSMIDLGSFYPPNDIRPAIGLISAFGLVVLSIMSKLPEIIPVMIKEMKGPDFGKAIGESFKGVGGILAIPGKGFSSYGEYEKTRTKIAERKRTEEDLSLVQTNKNRQIRSNSSQSTAPNTSNNPPEAPDRNS